MRLALYQPDIPQNAGALIRLGACLGVELDLIERLQAQTGRGQEGSSGAQGAAGEPSPDPVAPTELGDAVDADGG